MTSVAEGVESEGAYNILVANGCEQAQGFWISTPLQFDDYLNFLREQNRYPGSAIGCVHQAILNLVQFRKSLIDVAFCNNWVAGPMLESITDPDVALPPEQTRFGLWYYGPGRVLAEMLEFKALEEPFLAMNAESKELISSVEKGAERSTVNQHLEIVDKDMTIALPNFSPVESSLLRLSLLIDVSRMASIAASTSFSRIPMVLFCEKTSCAQSILSMFEANQFCPELRCTTSSNVVLSIPRRAAWCKPILTLTTLQAAM